MLKKWDHKDNKRFFRCKFLTLRRQIKKNEIALQINRYPKRKKEILYRRISIIGLEIKKEAIKRVRITNERFQLKTRTSLKIM